MDGSATISTEDSDSANVAQLKAARRIQKLTDLPATRDYLQRIGAVSKSLLSAVIEENAGRYKEEIARLTFTRAGEIKIQLRHNLSDSEATESLTPTTDELTLIKKEFAEAAWPEIKKVRNLPELSPELKVSEREDNLFVLRDLEGDILMVQQRILPRDSDKIYVSWTYWDDGEWRRMEPDGLLPLWGLESIKDHSVAFIHEGAKAARAVQRLVEGRTPDAAKALGDHPWGLELSAGVHLGWIGGARSPHRTDWSVLRRKGIKLAYIVADNDPEGLSAVPTISREVRVPADLIQFTSEWPGTFDLGDEFPRDMFKKIGEKSNYVGPSFHDCLHPATWMTDEVRTGAKGRPSFKLREHARDLWAYVEELDLFVFKGMPEIIRSETVLNKMLAPYSHTANVAGLIARAQRGRSTKVCYRPDLTGRVVTYGNTSAINLHTPTRINPRSGDVGPWLGFLEKLIPIERDRREVERWCATLIARPDVRMEYALLLVSEKQGVGKTTLGANVLAPLVGLHNFSRPTASTIVSSQFNGWIVNKRLVVIDEIYEGRSWKAYNTLKTYITDRSIEVNEKYKRPHTLENWAHIVASSNSLHALRIDQDDRRWLCPGVTDEVQSQEYYARFYEWLASGGLSIIYDWAKNYGDYVKAGERAPMTAAKREIIQESRSDAQKEMEDLCDFLKEEGGPICLLQKGVRAWLSQRISETIYDTDLALRKVAEAQGFKKYPDRIRVDSTMQVALMSPAFVEQHAALLASVERADQEKVREEIRKASVQVLPL